MKPIIALLLAFSFDSVSASLPDTTRWAFKVLLDDKEIGYHDFNVSLKGERWTVESEAKFDVKILFMNVYRYRHENVEEWTHNCLSSIDSETQANGKDYLVKGAATQAEFQVETQSETNSLPPCVMSFAYWNPEFLKADRLLNSQTGEYMDAEISMIGEESVLVNGIPVDAIKYQVNVETGPIFLWYAAGGYQWLALESEAAGGRVLRYQPIEVPDVLPGAAQQLSVL